MDVRPVARSGARDEGQAGEMQEYPRAVCPARCAFMMPAHMQLSWTGCPCSPLRACRVSRPSRMRPDESACAAWHDASHEAAKNLARCLHRVAARRRARPGVAGPA